MLRPRATGAEGTDRLSRIGAPIAEGLHPASAFLADVSGWCSGRVVLVYSVFSAGFLIHLAFVGTSKKTTHVGDAALASAAMRLRGLHVAMLLHSAKPALAFSSPAETKPKKKKSPRTMSSLTCLHA